MRTDRARRFNARPPKGLLFVALFAMAVTICVPQAHAASADPSIQPALWEITNGDSRVYVFGSYHILRKHTRWITSVLIRAMERSEIFVFEVPVNAESMKGAQAVIDARGYLPDGERLSDLLSGEARVVYHELLEDLPLDSQEMDRLQPWLARLSLSSAFYGEEDYSVRDGADIRIMNYAARRARPMRYLESPRQQLEFFIDYAAELQINDFEDMVTGLRLMPGHIAQSVNHWRAGDVEALAMNLQALFAENPAAKKRLLDDRNRVWAEQIEQMLTEERTIFVTVGVGHLGGPASVIDRLCENGWAIRRVPTGGERPPPACS